MTTLQNTLTQTLEARFGADTFTVGTPPEPVIVFPAAHPDVGRVQIWEWHDELLVAIENITHGHFTNYEESLSDEEYVHDVVQKVTDFLAALFSGQFLLYGSAQHGGGWCRIDAVPATERYKISQEEPTFLWTGPVNVDAAGTITPYSDAGQ